MIHAVTEYALDEHLRRNRGTPAYPSEHATEELAVVDARERAEWLDKFRLPTRDRICSALSALGINENRERLTDSIRGSWFNFGPVRATLG